MPEGITKSMKGTKLQKLWRSEEMVRGRLEVQKASSPARNAWQSWSSAEVEEPSVRLQDSSSAPIDVASPPKHFRLKILVS